MNRAIVVDEVSAGLIYMGESAPGADAARPIWRITRITVTGSITKIEFAGGNTAWNSVWNDRASLTYS